VKIIDRIIGERKYQSLKREALRKSGAGKLILAWKG